MPRIAFIILLFSFLGLNTPLAHAHPHVWVDMKSAPIFNEKGEMSGLTLTWLFGDFYSAFIMSEIPKEADGKPSQTALMELAKGNLANLADYNYYTNIQADNLDIGIKPVTSFTTGTSDHRLWMKFQVDFKTAVNPIEKEVRYAVYDPSYYIEILHDNKAQALLIDDQNKERCSVSLVPPSPPEEMSMMALSLDKNQKANDGLGAYFAEWVTLSCT